MQEVCRILRIRSIFTSPYNPASNGRLERAHQSFAAVISHYVSQDHGDWDEQLNFALFAYRNTKHRITGFTPAYLMYGRDLTMPWDSTLSAERHNYAEEPSYGVELQKRLKEAYEQATEFNRQNQEEERRKCNKGLTLPVVSVGQMVLLRNMAISPGQSKKLASRWIGPYKVTKVRSPVTFDIQHVQNGRRVTAHLRNLLPLPPDPEPLPVPNFLSQHPSTSPDTPEKSLPLHPSIQRDNNPSQLPSTTSQQQTPSEGETSTASSSQSPATHRIPYNLRPRPGRS